MTAFNDVHGINVQMPTPAPKREPVWEAWTLDPLVGRVKESDGKGKAKNQAPEELRNFQTNFKPWYSKQLDELIHELNMSRFVWKVVSLQLKQRSFFRRWENPPALKVVLQGEPRQTQQPRLVTETRMKLDTETQNEIFIQPVSNRTEAVPYSEVVEIQPIEQSEQKPAQSDEEIIRQQLTLYGSEDATSESKVERY